MKKAISLLVFTMLFLFTSSIHSFAEGFPKEENVAADKTWTIKFNLPIDDTTLENNIIVKDSEGNLINLTFSTEPDKKTVTVTPVDGYTPGKAYTLTVNTGLTSDTGKVLKEIATKEFTVKQEEIFTLTTTAYENGGMIPLKYAYQFAGGMNKSIPLKFTGAPEGTKSFAVFMYDLHPIADNWVHWAVTNIPASTTELIEGASCTSNMPSGSVELKNDFGEKGYGGPCPPQGTGNHEYKITVYALNTESLNLSGATSLSAFNAAINGKVLAESSISGLYRQ